ncbi:MAG TPA: ATPase [Limnochordia bacterium]|nr:ATPase [Limnochordia bacterium]
MNRMNMVLLLDRLHNLLSSAPEIPLSGRVIVQREEALDLIEKLRNAIPEEIEQAAQLASQQGRVVEAGKAEAQRILREAEDLVRGRVTDSEVTREAERQARLIIDEARKEAKRIEAGANQYAEGVLNNLQSSLEKTIGVVRRGRDELRRA